MITYNTPTLRALEHLQELKQELTLCECTKIILKTTAETGGSSSKKTIQLVNVCAPTTSEEDEKFEKLNDDIITARKHEKAHYVGSYHGRFYRQTSTKKNTKGPSKIWLDDIRRIAGIHWQETAQDTDAMVEVKIGVCPAVDALEKEVCCRGIDTISRRYSN
ncbi:hypothetical protein FQR65_LT13281 [Abscondita terminalis]|nr:hypothetical protein FQR65_LT13281 [Abscondita terminalis]